MTTNKITMKTVQQFMTDYQPIYSPLYGIFLDRAVAYSADVGRMDFRRVEAIGDIRQHRILPKDTEIKQINVTDTSKSYRKYFFANQYVVSDLQDQEGAADVVAQVLDEHQLQADEILMTGDGTSPADVLNNGLYFSADPNYTLEASKSIPAGETRLSSFHAAVVASATKANQIAGRKAILFYGEGILPLVNAIYPASSRAWKTVLQEVLGPDYAIIEVPSALTPSGANGWIVANYDQVKLHYTLLPELAAQGYNEEKMYYWFNFKMGSMMLEVLAKNGIIRQPVTLA